MALAGYLLTVLSRLLPRASSAATAPVVQSAGCEPGACLHRGLKFVLSIPSFSGNVLGDTTRFRARHAHQAGYGIAGAARQFDSGRRATLRLPDSAAFLAHLPAAGWSIAGAILPRTIAPSTWLAISKHCSKVQCPLGHSHPLS